MAFFALGFFSAAHGQTKIMEYKTGLAWDGSQTYLNGGLMSIGKDFLALPVNRPPSFAERDQILYIFNIKKKSLAQKLDEANRGFYWVTPSTTTRSFILGYFDGLDNWIEFHNFNAKSKTWSKTLPEKVDTGFAVTGSFAVAPAYFVNAVKGHDDTLELHIFRY